MPARPGLFGSSKDELWRQLAEELHGEFRQGTWRTGSSVQVHEGPWTVTLDSYVVTAGQAALPYTRLRAPYVNPDGFRFHIYRAGVASAFAKAFGMQDIAIGAPDFDREFIIQGNHPAKVQTLFGNESIRRDLKRLERVNFSVRSDQGWFRERYPDGVDELCFEVPGVLTDLEQLKLVFDLFSETLHTLCRMGSAYEQDPGLRLGIGEPDGPPIVDKYEHGE